MNLQICFMNETASDTESPVSDSETPTTAPAKPEFEKKHPTQTKTMPVKVFKTRTLSSININ